MVVGIPCSTAVHNAHTYIVEQGHDECWTKHMEYSVDELFIEDIAWDIDGALLGHLGMSIEIQSIKRKQELSLSLSPLSSSPALLLLFYISPKA